jgi:RNA polymerase sigma-70 factor (ECF subfamily)
LDKSVVERAMRGDVDAFELLVRESSPSCYAVCLHVVGTREDALDASQEALIRAWRRLPTLRDPSSFEPWLRSIAANAARDLMRERARVRSVPVGLAADLPDPSHPGSATRLDIQGALASLPAPARAAAERHYLRDEPVSEVSAGLGIPEGTVKSRLHTARAALRRALVKERR